MFENSARSATGIRQRILYLADFVIVPLAIARWISVLGLTEKEATNLLKLFSMVPVKRHSKYRGRDHIENHNVDVRVSFY